MLTPQVDAVKEIFVPNKTFKFKTFGIKQNFLINSTKSEISKLKYSKAKTFGLL